MQTLVRKIKGGEETWQQLKNTAWKSRVQLLVACFYLFLGILLV